MNIPILETKGLKEPGIITPEETMKKEKKLPPHIDTAVLFFDPSPEQALIDDSEELFKFVAASSILPQYIYKDKLVLAYSPLGGPAAGGLIEELYALGIKRVIACGSCGLIDDIDTTRLLLVSKAIRDEGLSYHYLEPSTYVETSKDLNKAIEQHLLEHNIEYLEEIVWTTDGFFRETKTRIDLRRSQGAVAVEMECASMAAVCKYRQIAFSQVLYFSDIVKQEGWSGFVKDRKTIKDTVNKIIINIALEIIKK